MGFLGRLSNVKFDILALLKMVLFFPNHSGKPALLGLIAGVPRCRHPTGASGRETRMGWAGLPAQILSPALLSSLGLVENGQERVILLLAISHISSVHEMHPLSGNAGSSFLGREMTKSPSDATTPSERADLNPGVILLSISS